jgi:hypothetical protein
VLTVAAGSELGEMVIGLVVVVVVAAAAMVTE